MALIIWFLALVAAGDVLAYLVGLFVEYEWGGYTSLVVFLAMYFITLWVAWRIAVWMTTPKWSLTAGTDAVCRELSRRRGLLHPSLCVVTPTCEPRF
jgi:hypothetical protein